MYNDVLVQRSNEHYLDTLIRSFDAMKTWTIRALTDSWQRTSPGTGNLSISCEYMGTGSVLIEDRSPISGSNLPRTAPAADQGRRDLLLKVKASFGLNMTELASVLRVGRPTIYAWLNESVEPRSANLRRINSLAGLSEFLVTPPDLGARSDDGRTLLEVLSAPELDLIALSRVLSAVAAGSVQGSSRLSTALHGYSPTSDARDRLDILTGRRLSDDD
jgi:hypothetical protein